MILHAKVFYYKRLQPFERRRIITLLQGGTALYVPASIYSIKNKFYIIKQGVEIMRKDAL